MDSQTCKHSGDKEYRRWECTKRGPSWVWWFISITAGHSSVGLGGVLYMRAVLACPYGLVFTLVRFEREVRII